jgi:hypothetical protein
MDHSHTAVARDLIGVRVLLLHIAVWQPQGPVLFMGLAYRAPYFCSIDAAHGVRCSCGNVSKIKKYRDLDPI